MKNTTKGQNEQPQTRRRGFVQKRGDSTWLVRIFVGYKEDGSREYHNKTIKGLKADADKYLTDKLREKDLGMFVAPTTITLSEYLDKWLEVAAKPRLRERTLEDYKEYLKRYVRPTIGSKRLSEIRPLHVQQVYTNMQTNGLSARTVRYCHAILSSALKQAVKWQMLAINPASMADLPRQQRKEMNALSPEEAGRFLDAAESDKWHIIFALALTSGMRPEEYLALQWKDFDSKAGTVTVTRAIVWRRKGGGWKFEPPKTPQSRRTIPLPLSVIRLLQEHRRKQNEERLKAGPAYQHNDFIFAGESGTPIRRENLFRRHFKPLLKAANLPSHIRLYDLRHTCATLLMAAGENPKVVSERLGHASIVLTLDTYSHVLPNMQQAATAKLESLLFGTR